MKRLKIIKTIKHVGQYWNKHGNVGKSRNYCFTSSALLATALATGLATGLALALAIAFAAATASALAVALVLQLELLLYFLQLL